MGCKKNKLLVDRQKESEAIHSNRYVQRRNSKIDGCQMDAGDGSGLRGQDGEEQNVE